MRNTSSASALSSVAVLVLRLEAALKGGQQFAVLRPIGETAILKCLALQEINVFRKGGKFEVRVICEATFRGKHAPHVILMSANDQALNGVADLQMGMGSHNLGENKAVKGLSFKVLPQLLHGALARDVARLTGQAASDLEAQAHKALTETGTAVKKAAASRAKAAATPKKEGADKMYRIESLESALAVAAHLLRHGHKCELRPAGKSAFAVCVNARVPDKLLPISVAG